MSDSVAISRLAKTVKAEVERWALTETQPGLPISPEMSLSFALDHEPTSGFRPDPTAIIRCKIGNPHRDGSEFIITISEASRNMP